MSLTQSIEAVHSAHGQNGLLPLQAVAHAAEKSPPVWHEPFSISSAGQRRVMAHLNDAASRCRKWTVFSSHDPDAINFFTPGAAQHYRKVVALFTRSHTGPHPYGLFTYRLLR